LLSFAFFPTFCLNPVFALRGRLFQVV
jgi:hypothetical protein